MTLDSARLSAVTPPFELKGSLFTLTVLYLRDAEQAAVAGYLAEKIRQAPGFFNQMPVVLDLEALAGTHATVDFVALIHLLRGHGVIPVAVRNGDASLQAAAVLAGLPLLPEGRAAGARKPDKVEPAPPRRSRLITQPVRSGQQIYAPEGDLILLGTISPGAEVLADGNIHIYGTLRGRALAGVRGDTEARIFCQSLEAELVSVAGHYRVMDQVDAADRDKPVQIYLANERLLIEPLSR
jgi:septum site-determining protein MinC